MLYAQWNEDDERFAFSLLDNGGFPVTKAEHQRLLDGIGSGMRIVPGADGKPELVPQSDATPALDRLCHKIDAAADEARRAVAGDPLCADEHKRAAAEALSFVEAGCKGEVPRSVAAWAIGGRTPKEAAEDILAKAELYKSALYLIREKRLSAKEAVRAAIEADDQKLATQIALEAIDVIKSCTSQ